MSVFWQHDTHGHPHICINTISHMHQYHGPRAERPHDAFIKHFKKYQHEYGLPPATPSTAGSKTSSRAVSVIGEEEEEEEIEEDEEAGAA